MKHVFPVAAFVSVLGGGLFFAAAANAAADLEPIPSRLISTGTVSIRNAGGHAAGPTVAIVTCHKVGHVGPGGGCPDLDVPPEYHNAAYPDAVAVNIPKIKAGHVYSHTLSFWAGMVWPPGDYTLTITADAGNAVVESNEVNNTAAGVKHSP